MLHCLQVTQTSGVAGFKTVMRVRITLPPPRSLDCREIPSRLTQKCAEYARISRLFPRKPDPRERTARHRMRNSPGFSPEDTCAVRFPGGRKANAMRSRRWGVGSSELTSVSALETEFDVSRKPVSGPRHVWFRVATTRMRFPRAYSSSVRNPPTVAPVEPRKHSPY